MPVGHLPEGERDVDKNHLTGCKDNRQKGMGD